MAPRPRLSIVLSCHSKTPWFSETLESVLQGYHFRNTEIIICDDSSPEGGDGDTARDYAKRYPDLIRTFRNSDRGGIVRAYSRLQEEARGEYFMPFDSDDIFVSFDIDGAMDFLDEKNDFAAVYGKKRLFSSTRGDHCEMHGGEHSAFAMLVDPRVTHNAMIIRVSDLEEAGGYMETDRGRDTAVTDVFMWVRLCMRKKLFFNDQLCAFYRMHEGQHIKARMEAYNHDYAYMREWLGSRFSELYDGLKERRPIQVNDDNRSVVQMLLGGMFRGSSSPQHQLDITDTAARVMPDDYAVYEHRANLLLRHGKSHEALRDAWQALLCMPESSYVGTISSKIALQAAEKIWNEKGVFEKGYHDFLTRLFKMTPEQQMLLDNAIAHAREHQGSDQPTC